MQIRSRAVRAVASLAAALVTLTLTTGTVAQARPTHIDPAALPRGDNPKIPYVVGNRLRDGHRSIRVAKARHHVELFETRRGYVVVDNVRGKRAFRITAVSKSGQRRVLGRPDQSYSAAVSPRGHRLAWVDVTGDVGTRSVVRVVNPHTGRLLAKRVFRNAEVVLVTRRKVLLSRTHQGDNTTTAWWNYRRDTVRQISDQRALHADLRHDIVVLAKRVPSRCTFVTRLSRPSTLRYRSCGITPHAWSPNGKRALATHIYFDTPGTDRWVTTSGRTGKRLARVTGRLDWDVAWESNRHYLTMAQSDRGKAAVIRCTPAGRCERASRLWSRAVNPDFYYTPPPVLLSSS